MQALLFVSFYADIHLISRRCVVVIRKAWQAQTIFGIDPQNPPKRKTRFGEAGHITS